jgi:hypothetical protein
MTDSTLIAIAAALLAALLLAWWLLRRRRATAPQRSHEAEVLDTVQDWPPQAVRVMTLPERLAYGTLRKALPRHLVLAQVPLSRFISVPSGRSYSQWLVRAGRLNVDLLVCDSSSRVVAAVEVRAADETARSTERHERLAKVLSAAGIKVFVWQATNLPSLAAVRELFNSKAENDADGAEASRFNESDRHFLPVPEIQEMLMEGDAFNYNMNNEPVPSGFFDDLEASPPARRSARAA